jgi:DNA-binding NarL/FixJ family response regulator
LDPQIRTKLFLVDDHVLFRSSLTEVFHREADLEVVGEAAEPPAALAAVASAQPNVVLLEWQLSEGSGAQLLAQLPKCAPGAAAIVFTNSEDECDVVEAMRHGARGFLHKKASTATLLKCVRQVAAGQIWLENQHLEMILKALRNGLRGARAELSTRERDVVRLLLTGAKNKEIAAALSISEKTVKNHLSNVFDKLGVKDRLELALMVHAQKLL